MKKFAVFVMTAALLLAGCATQAPVPVETPPAESQDIDAIIQRSVDEAMAQYEEEQRAKDAEIEALKDQLEALTAQKEEAPAESAPETAAPQPESAPAGETSDADAPASQGDTAGEPESLPPSEPAPPKSSPSSSGSGQGFDLKNLYPSFVFGEAYREEETAGDEDIKEEPEEPLSGEALEDDALEVIRLTNIQRENHGLEPLETDEDLMALAQVRAEEVSIKYSHERPDGTRVVKEHPGYGENVGAKASAEKQVTSWMSSEGHCANILRERFHRIGVGCYRAANGNHYWVQVFAP